MWLNAAVHATVPASAALFGKPLGEAGPLG